MAKQKEAALFPRTRGNTEVLWGSPFVTQPQSPSLYRILHLIVFNSRISVCVCVCVCVCMCVCLMVSISLLNFPFHACTVFLSLHSCLCVLAAADLL